MSSAPATGRIPLSEGLAVATVALQRCAELENSPQERDWISNSEQQAYLNGLITRLLENKAVLRAAPPEQFAALHDMF